MLTRLQSRGMNYPLTDEESSERMVQSCTHWWLAPEILPILRELDTVRKRAKAQRLLSKRGNRPLPEGTNDRIIIDSSPTPYLPQNWYRQEWYDNLTQYQKLDIAASEATENFPNIVSRSGMISALLLLTSPLNSMISLQLAGLYRRFPNGRNDDIVRRRRRVKQIVMH